MRYSALVLILALGAWHVAAAYDAQPRKAVSLEGSWRVNAAASDNVDELIAKLIEKDAKERRQWRRRMEQEDRFYDAGPLQDPPDAARRQAEADQWRHMLGVTQALELRQQGVSIEISSDTDVRRLEAGSRGQVSMRSGDVADSHVGWDGEWFVIDRKVPHGERELERLRHIERTDQLEYVVKWSGDSELSGVKLRLIFDRVK